MLMNNKQADQVLEQIKNSDAIIFESRLKTLTINYYVFDKNYESLKEPLKMMKDPKVFLKVWDQKNPTKLEIIQYDVVRRLLNYLSSAMSLKEYTRILIEFWYKDTSFEKDYKKEIETRFKGNAVVGFIEELRNYSLHYSLPISFPQFSIDLHSRAIEHKFLISKKSLLNWSGWKTKARPYLDAQSDEIDMEKLIEKYYEIVSSFHHWLYDQILFIHKDDIEWISGMRKKLSQLLPDDIFE